jgi:hypothetical protein
METTNSSSSRFMAYVKCVVYLTLSMGFLMFVVPILYELNSTLRHSVREQQKYEIEAGSIYYTEVPISFESEMACRYANQRAIEMRAAAIK